MRFSLLRRKRDAVAQQAEASASSPLLVVGLGNPGGRYLATRHNVGFEVVELLAARAQTRLRRGKFRCAQAEARLADQRVILIQPHTYMNRSGAAVRGAADYYKVPLSRLLVVCDDVHLPLGKIRLRRSGSAGGHNGLISVIEALGNEEFPRLRIGVGEPPPHMDQVSYVLSRFAREEQEVIAAAIARAADAVEAWVSVGITEAMNRFN
ncbi:MAG: aminoacyl-tRNA hydrolase [Armatimonadota bacterium]|nr:MAG: aminoacyl-tRNA hydrolase [Armatimonadota bacterium]